MYHTMAEMCRDRMCISACSAGLNSVYKNLAAYGASQGSEMQTEVNSHSQPKNILDGRV